MDPKNRKIYWTLFLLSLAGYIWLGYHLLMHDRHQEAVTLCMFKNITGLPCPSCGITRSVLYLLQGNVWQAILINPLGIVAAILLVVIPPLLVRDLVLNQQHLGITFQWAEEKIRTKKRIYIPLILLIVINWGWNIMKDL